MTNASTTTAWIGTLGGPADQRHLVAAALAEVFDTDDAFFVPVSTDSVDERARRRTQPCRLDAAVLLVSATSGPASETDHLLRLLAEYDVPVVVAFADLNDGSVPEPVRSATAKLTAERLGYQAPNLALRTTDHDDVGLKSLAEEAQALAAKRRVRRGAERASTKDYPFVVSQLALDRLMRDNVRHALTQHRERGESVAVWRDGRVAILDPDAIELPSP